MIRDDRSASQKHRALRSYHFRVAARRVYTLLSLGTPALQRTAPACLSRARVLSFVRLSAEIRGPRPRHLLSSDYDGLRENLMDSELLQLLQECELSDEVIGWMRDV